MTNVTGGKCAAHSRVHLPLRPAPVRRCDCKQKSTVGQSFHVIGYGTIENQDPVLPEIEYSVSGMLLNVTIDCFDRYPPRVLMQFNADTCFHRGQNYAEVVNRTSRFTLFPVCPASA